MDIQALCAKYDSLSPSQKLWQVFDDFDKVLVTSSFGTSSAFLLHHLHRVRPEQSVYFIDTTYHFKETYDYRKKIEDTWGLKVITIKPKAIENRHTLLSWTWTYDSEACCEINKVEPLQELKSQFDVWISGMVGRTTERRKNMEIFEHDGDILRFYPFLDLDPQEVEWYRKIYDLPDHPLESEGYGSVGCTHCTVKGKGREGRWKGKDKKECGLHMFKTG